MALVRVIGRWSLTALVINGIVGSGIFGLPAQTARVLGVWSPVAYVIAAGVIGVVMGCFAEVGSRFDEPGGPYLYAKTAFGRLPGIEIGWLAYLARITATAANLNLLVIYLAEFFPGAGGAGVRVIILSVVVGVLAAVNYCGVGPGARVSNVLAAIKIVALFVFVGMGVAFVASHGAVRHVSPPHAVALTGSAWFSAVLPLMFLYGGFEAALIPAGETRSPGRDTPFALFTAFVVVTVLFTTIQFLVVALLSDFSTDRPLGEAARYITGGWGAKFIAITAIGSVFGNLAGQMLSAPRLTYALAEKRDFPRLFARVDRRFKTPGVSIVVFAALTWGLAVHGGFVWNVSLSAVARLGTYGATCAALPVLRRRGVMEGRGDAGTGGRGEECGKAGFALPAGMMFAVLGIVFCAVLLTRMSVAEFVILGATTLLAVMNWMFVRGTPAAHREQLVEVRN